MAAMFNTCNTDSRCMSAACSSAQIRPVLDAAIVLVVSICVVCVRIILQAA